MNKVSQDTFDHIVSENVDTFDMTVSEAIIDAIEQVSSFKFQFKSFFTYFERK